MKHLIVVLALLLSACASNPEVVQQTIPVTKGCVPKNAPVRPAIKSETLEKIKTEEDSIIYVKALYGDLYAFEKYAMELEIIVAGCPKKEK